MCVCAPSEMEKDISLLKRFCDSIRDLTSPPKSFSARFHMLLQRERLTENRIKCGIRFNADWNEWQRNANNRKHAH